LQCLVINQQSIAKASLFEVFPGHVIYSDL
jgi:hypothetical protein